MIISLCLCLDEKQLLLYDRAGASSVAVVQPSDCIVNFVGIVDRNRTHYLIITSTCTYQLLQLLNNKLNMLREKMYRVHMSEVAQ